VVLSRLAPLGSDRSPFHTPIATVSTPNLLILCRTFVLTPPPSPPKSGAAMSPGTASTISEKLIGSPLCLPLLTVFGIFLTQKRKKPDIRNRICRLAEGLVIFHNSENSHRLWLASSISLKLSSTKSITERELEVHYKKELEGSNWRKKRGKVEESSSIKIVNKYDLLASIWMYCTAWYPCSTIRWSVSMLISNVSCLASNQ